MVVVYLKKNVPKNETLKTVKEEVSELQDAVIELAELIDGISESKEE